MNPEENPMGMGMTSMAGATPEPNMMGSNPATDLSMEDTMASAQDNLTSAGMAATAKEADAVGLDEIGASMATAEMERPDEPLVPAAPVPGSIGSAISGPAVTAEAPAAAPTMPVEQTAAPVAPAPTMPVEQAVAPAQAPATPFVTAPVQPVQTAAPVMPTAPAQPVQAAAPTMPAASAMPTTPAMTPDLSKASSTEVPTASQPKTAAFMGLSKDKNKIIMTILVVALVVLLAVAGIFLALWLQEKKNIKTVYVASPIEEAPKALTISCTHEYPGGEVFSAEGVGDVSVMDETLGLKYVGDDLKEASGTRTYWFTDPGLIDGQMEKFATYTTIAEQTNQGSNGAVSLRYNRDENKVVFEWTVDVDHYDETAQELMRFPVDEFNEVMTDADNVQMNYEDAGMVCEVTD